MQIPKRIQDTFNRESKNYQVIRSIRGQKALDGDRTIATLKYPQYRWVKGQSRPIIETGVLTIGSVDEKFPTKEDLYGA